MRESGIYRRESRLFVRQTIETDIQRTSLRQAGSQTTIELISTSWYHVVYVAAHLFTTFYRNVTLIRLSSCHDHRQLDYHIPFDAHCCHMESILCQTRLSRHL